MTRLTLKPFIKWAGGKSQLLPTLRTRYPSAFKRYVEPFVGGGAVLWDILSRYRLKEVYISDLNGPLINTYLVIQQELPALIRILSALKLISGTLQKNIFELKITKGSKDSMR
jgi:DNA adenine methylase